MDEIHEYEFIHSAIECGRDWVENQELYHHGVKGQKHGVRRYQNKDGSLTALGRVHYGVGKAGDAVGSGFKKAGEVIGKAGKSASKAIGKAVKDGIDKHNAKVAEKKERERIKKLMSTPLRKLTTEQLAERAKRAEAERNLSNTESQYNDKVKGFLSKFGSKMLNDAVIPAATNVGKSFLEKSLKNSLGLDKADMTNTFKILKKAGMDYDKLTDKELEALAKRQKNVDDIKKSRNP